MYVSGPLRQRRLSNSARDQVTEQKRLPRTSCRCSCLAGLGGGAGGESPTLTPTLDSVYSTRRLPPALGSSYGWCLVGLEITQSLDSCEPRGTTVWKAVCRFFLLRHLQSVFDPHGYHTDTDSPTLSRADVITPGCNVHGESDRLPSRGMRLLDPAAQQHVLTSSHA